MKIQSRQLEKAMDYLAYRKLIEVLLMEGKTTGQNQSSMLTDYTKLNVARMKRVDKTVEILPGLQEFINLIDKPQTWIVITEGWCGDAAQTVPLFNALAKLNDKINLQLVLRDENLELMDNYLTDGKSRSIPKLIVTRTENLEEIFNWGPRPQALQKIFDEMRAADVPYAERAEKLHAWYAKDKTVSTQKEILEFFEARNSKTV